jgi:hypothetical protein
MSIAYSANVCYWVSNIQSNISLLLTKSIPSFALAASTNVTVSIVYLTSPTTAPNKTPGTRNQITAQTLAPKMFLCFFCNKTYSPDLICNSCDLDQLTISATSANPANSISSITSTSNVYLCFGCNKTWSRDYICQSCNPTSQRTRTSLHRDRIEDWRNRKEQHYDQCGDYFDPRRPRLPFEDRGPYGRPPGPCQGPKGCHYPMW